MAIEKSTPANTQSSLSRFLKIVLGWDYIRLLTESKKRDAGGGTQLKQIKSSYKDFEEYVKFFEPLLFEEVKANIMQRSDEDEGSGFEMGAVANCAESDGFYKVDLVLKRDEFREEVAENDLLLLSEKENHFHDFDLEKTKGWH